MPTRWQDKAQSWARMGIDGAAQRAIWSWRGPDGWVMGALAAWTFASRLPYRAKYLNSWDSFNFALALEDYDVVGHRPHPPGYPIYVFLGRLLLPFSGDANAALVTLGMLSSVVAVAGLYWLLRHFASPLTAAVGAFSFSLAPVFLFNGVIALSYASEAAASVAFALVAWKTLKTPTWRRLVLVGFLWSVAIGLRQSLLFFLTPLAVYVTLANVRHWRDLARSSALSAGAAVVTTALWFFPMIWSTTGGWKAWYGLTEHQTKYTVFWDTAFNNGWPSVVDKVNRLEYFLHFEEVVLKTGLVTVGVGLILALVISTPRLAGVHFPWRLTIFFTLWILPSVAFYSTIYNGGGRHPPGYVLVFLPALYGVFALVGEATLRFAHHAARGVDARRVATLLLLPLLLFPMPELRSEWDAFHRAEVRDRDEWADGWSRLAERFPASNSSIMAWSSWGHARYYFPDHVVWGYFPIRALEGPDSFYLAQSRHRKEDLPPNWPPDINFPVPDHVENVVLMDFQLAGEFGRLNRIQTDIPVHETFLSNGWRILFFHPTANRTMINEHIISLPEAYAA